MFAFGLAQIAAATLGPARVEAYGVARVDAVADDSPTNDITAPLYVRDEPAGADPNEPLREGQFAIHPQLSRLGVNLKGGTAVRGNVEVDFQDLADERARTGLRLRHAYLEVRYPAGAGHVYLLGGQTWDVIAPLVPSVNHATHMWNAGNVGDRRPQLRLTYVQGWLNAALAAAQTGAVDGRDFDEDGVDDGVDAARPGWQARLGADTRAVKAGLGFAIGRTDADNYSDPVLSRVVALDLALRLHRVVGLRAEAFFGADLADFRGGIGQGIIDPATAGAPLDAKHDLVQSMGGWLEVPVRATRRWTVTPGVSLDDPKDSLIRDRTIDGGPPRLQNIAYYLGNRVQLGEGVAVGVELMRWATVYQKTSSNPDANVANHGATDRLDLWLSYTP